MKVIAQTAALQEGLALVGSIVASRTPKPVLQCIKLVAAGNVLTLMGTDLEAGARYNLTAVQIEQEGEALIPADRFAGIVRESAGEDSLTLATEKEAVTIHGSGSRFKVFGYDPAEYPMVADFTEPADFSLPAGAMGHLITKTLFAAAKSHSHYAISGVLWETSGKKLQLVATDGHRLAQAWTTLSKSVGKNVTAIVPAKIMTLIQRIASDGEENLDVKVEENQILIRTARAVLVSTLVQGNFPKYVDVIPKEINRKASIATELLERSLRKAALLTNEESRGVKLSFQGTDRLTLSSRSPERGEAEITCPVGFEGEQIDIAFNPGFLLDALRVVDCDQVSFEMNAANKPAVLRAGSDFLYVLMPVELG